MTTKLYIMIIGKPINMVEARITSIIQQAIPKAFSKEDVDEIERIGLCAQRVNLFGVNPSQRTLCTTKTAQVGVVA